MLFYLNFEDNYTILMAEQNPGHIKDRVLLFFSIILLGTAIVYLYDSDRFYQMILSRVSSNTEKGEILATLSEKTSLVRKKVPGSLSWQELELNEGLYQNDQVFTAKNSRGVILFKDKINSV